MRRSLWILLLIFAAVLGILCFWGRHEQSEEIASSPIEEKLPDADHSGTEDTGELAKDRLAEEIMVLSSGDSTRYSVYIAYPGEERPPYIYQSESMRSASMIKVFLLAAAMEKVKDGSLHMGQPIVLHSKDKVGGSGILGGYPNGFVLRLDSVLRLMITESDNTATNILIDLLGMDNINAYIKEKGYNDTCLSRKMMDFAAVKNGRENYTSVRDLGCLFDRIYRHECVSYEHDEIMLSYLKEQTDKECFPSALPETIIAHKTGELEGLYDDGGIIYLGDKVLIIVIMTENYSSRYNAIETMKSMVRAAAK